MTRLELSTKTQSASLGVALGVVGMFALGTIAQAATVTADFDFTGNGYAWETSFTDGSLTVDVSAYNYQAPNFLTDENEPVNLLGQIGISFNTNGLGACSAATDPADTNCGTRPLLDGQDDPEMLIFAFDSAVTITGILFANNDSNDLVDIFLGDDLQYAVAGNTPLPPDRLNLASFGPVTRLAIGNQSFSDQYRIASISVEYQMIPPPPPPPPPPNPVPLPAAGWLLLGGIGGLTALRRRQRKS